jgi:Fe2+ transport system protein FeoA
MNTYSLMFLSELIKGEKGIIEGYLSNDSSNKSLQRLLELGFVKGKEVVVEGKIGRAYKIKIEDLGCSYVVSQGVLENIYVKKI